MVFVYVCVCVARTKCMHVRRLNENGIVSLNGHCGTIHCGREKLKQLMHAIVSAFGYGMWIRAISVSMVVTFSVKNENG